MGLALLQVTVGILFFKIRSALVWFFFQSFLILVAALATVSFTPDASRMGSWSCRAAFAILFLAAFRSWRKKRAES